MDNPTSARVIEFPSLKVLEFNFAAIQRNRLDWREFLNQPNPVAAALKAKIRMAKMQIAPKDRPRVKAECLRLLATLRLDPARTRLISAFVDTYLRLNAQEEQVFQTEIGKLETDTQEGIMQIVTSWIQQGIEQGLEQGIERGQRALVLRLLSRRVGDVPQGMVQQIEGLSLGQLEALAEALLDFQTLADLEAWVGEQA